MCLLNLEFDLQQKLSNVFVSVLLTLTNVVLLIDFSQCNYLERLKPLLLTHSLSRSLEAPLGQFILAQNTLILIVLI